MQDYNEENESENYEADYDELDLQGVLKEELSDAKDFIDEVGRERVESTEYYMGESPASASASTSQFVSTDVREAVLHLLPSLMRTFFGTEKIVEFLPKNAEDIPIAEQQTDYINYIIQQKNDGFKVLYDAFKDALVRKTGFVKAFWDFSLNTTTHEYTGLSEEAYMALVMDSDVEILKESSTEGVRIVINQETGEEIEQPEPKKYNLKIRRVKENSGVVIEAVPPEEILVARNARSLKEASYVAHRRVCSVSDLVAMGYDQEMVEQHSGYGQTDFDMDEEERARNPFSEGFNHGDAGVAGKEVLYIEHYLFYDKDEDGIDELIKVCTIGGGLHIINCEAWDELPIVMFCPDPEPHTAIGSCPADYLKPIQAAKSQIIRDTLDSLGHSIYPRYSILEGQVNIDDVLNTDIGQPIRVRQQGAVQSFTVPFVGKDAFPVLSYMDDAKENRTGVSKAAMGLNADALQSTTASAVQATMSGSQGRVELICRHFAQDLKELFKLTNALVCKNQEAEEMVRLNNRFVPVDPRYWDAEKDLVVNVAISKMADTEKMTLLTQMLAKQEQILQTLGPDNPLVNMQQYANTMARLIELAGFKNPQEFVNTRIDPAMASAKPPEKPDPTELLAQAEVQKAQVQAQKAMVDAETDRMKLIMQDDLDRDKFEVDAIMKAAELGAKYGSQVNMAQVSALLERDKEVIRNEQKLQAQGLFRNDNQEG